MLVSSARAAGSAGEGAGSNTELRWTFSRLACQSEMELAQDNNHYTTFVQLNVHSCNACNAAQCSGFEQVQASGGAPGRGGVNPLGFSPALLRGGDGRLGRSLDPILLYYQSYHSWTIVSVTAVTFTARSVHSRGADPDTLHFRARRGSSKVSMAIGILPAVACPSPPAPTRYSRPSRPRRRLS